MAAIGYALLARGQYLTFETRKLKSRLEFLFEAIALT
jgi:hypothetical protein